MNRLAATLLLDVKLQARSRLYYIGVAVAVLGGVAMGQFFNRAVLTVALPAFFLLGLGNTTYVFVGGMILFEKREGTLDAISVSPLGIDDYIVSKVVTLAGFASVESAITIAIAYGMSGFNALALFAGIFATGAMYALIGVAQVVRYRSVTDWLLPGALIVGTIPGLPLIHYFGVAGGAVWYLMPTYASLLLMDAAFRELTRWEWAYATGYTALSLALMYAFARWQFQKHIVERASP